MKEGDKFSVACKKVAKDREPNKPQYHSTVRADCSRSFHGVVYGANEFKKEVKRLLEKWSKIGKEEKRSDEMYEIAWGGNITLKMKDNENTWGPVGFIEVKEYAQGAFRLQFVGGGGECSATLTMNKDDVKGLVKKLTDVL